MPVEFGDDVALAQSEQFCGTIDVQFGDFDAPFFGARKTASARRILDSQEALIARVGLGLNRWKMAVTYLHARADRCSITIDFQRDFFTSRQRI